MLPRACSGGASIEVKVVEAGMFGNGSDGVERLEPCW